MFRSNYRWWLKSWTGLTCCKTAKVGFDAYSEGIFQYPGAGWRSISHNMSCSMKNLKVTWSYQKGKYCQQVDSPSTYTQDRSVMYSKGLKIWWRPERKHQIRKWNPNKTTTKSGIAVVPKLHICWKQQPKQPIQFGRDPVKILPPSNQAPNFGFGGHPKELEDLTFLICGPPPPGCHLRHRREGIWNLMASLKARQNLGSLWWHYSA